MVYSCQAVYNNPFQCGYAINQRREPLCAESGPLEGPLAEFGREDGGGSEELVVATGGG